MSTFVKEYIIGCAMCQNTKNITPYTCSPCSKWSTRRTVANGHNGSHHRSATSQTIWLNTHNSRQKHKRGHIHPMHKKHRHRRNCRPLYEKHMEMVWTTKKNHIRQRTAVCCKIHQRTLEETRSNHCVIHSIPSRNRQRNRKSQPRTRTIPLSLLQLWTNQLAGTPIVCWVCTQCSRILSYALVTVPTHVWIQFLVCPTNRGKVRYSKHKTMTRKSEQNKGRNQS